MFQSDLHILRCENCHCGVKVESKNIGYVGGTPTLNQWNDFDHEDLLFTVLKNAK